MIRYRRREIHETDPIKGQPCDECHEPLKLGDVVIFDEDDGTHGKHEACHAGT